MTGLEVAEERERDSSRQRRRDDRSAAALPATDTTLEKEEQDLAAAHWVADTQLQISLPSYLDAEDYEDWQGKSSSSLSDDLSDAHDNEDDAGPSCQP
jgi:hypothetical protein